MWSKEEIFGGLASPSHQKWRKMVRIAERFLPFSAFVELTLKVKATTTKTCSNPWELLNKC